MADALRTIRAIVGAALAVDPRATLLVFGLGILAWVGNALQALTVAVFIHAFITHDGALALIAVPANAVAFGANNYLFSLQHAIGLTLQEKTTHALDQRLQGLVGGIAGIEHLERPEYLDRLSTLQTQNYWFGNVGHVLGLPAVLLNVVATAALLFAIEPVLALVPFASLPSFLLDGRAERTLRAAEEASAPSRRLRRRMLELATDADAAAEARLFEAGREELARFDAADAAYQRMLDVAAVRGVAYSTIGWALFAIAFAGAFVVVAGSIRDGRLPLAALFAMVYLVRLASFHASVTLNSIAGIRRTIAATRNFLWLADHAVERQGPAVREVGARALPSAGTLRFRDVTFRYPGAARDALTGITLEVPAGCALALVGDNGAGKTTLVKLLARFYDPTGGTIDVNGVDLRSLDVGAWRAGLTACFQDFSRFEFLARETVGSGWLAAIDDEAAVRGAVEAAGAEDVIVGLPSDLATQLGAGWDDGAELSAGQWQKLALGRSMMRGTPRLLLLDEPTAALDATAEARLFERYAAASEFARTSGSITVIVSHRMSTVRMADVIAVMEDGRITQFGTHQALVGIEGPYRDLYRTQAAAYAS